LHRRTDLLKYRKSRFDWKKRFSFLIFKTFGEQFEIIHKRYYQNRLFFDNFVSLLQKVSKTKQ